MFRVGSFRARSDARGRLAALGAALVHFAEQVRPGDEALSALLRGDRVSHEEPAPRPQGVVPAGWTLATTGVRAGMELGRAALGTALDAVDVC